MGPMPKGKHGVGVGQQACLPHLPGPWEPTVKGREGRFHNGSRLPGPLGRRGKVHVWGLAGCCLVCVWGVPPTQPVQNGQWESPTMIVFKAQVGNKGGSGGRVQQKAGKKGGRYV